MANPASDCVDAVAEVVTTEIDNAVNGVVDLIGSIFE
jgi:hypothetical protein